MATYRGQTYRIPAMRGGWNANPNFDLIPPESMVEAVNINLHRGGRETRGGVVKVNLTPISASPRITGVFQFRKKDGTTSIVTTTTDGKIQKNYSTVLKTGLTTGQFSTFEVLNDTLYICNGADVPQTWDGVAGSTSNLTNPAADWTGSSYPKRMVKHGRGVSERLWAFGASSNLESVYASATGSDDFVTGVVKIDIETGDGFGVVGMEEYGDRLIPIGKRRPYLIDDLSDTAADWGYDAAQWEGGVGSDRLLVKTPNDLIAMSEDGEIYSIITTQETGDYRASSIARPAFIHKWIEDNVDLTKVADFHMAYDPVLRAVKVFVMRNAESKIDTVLTYFIDRPPEEAWTRHRFFNTDFASTSIPVRVAAGDWKVYVGGHTGTVYQLESSVFTDDGAHYYNGFTTVDNPFDNPRVQKRYDRGWLVVLPQSSETIKINTYIDGEAVTGGFTLVDEGGNEIVDESGNFIQGLELLPTSVIPVAVSTGTLTDASHGIGKIGKRIQEEIFQDTTGESMFVSQIMYDFVPLGPAPH